MSALANVSIEIASRGAAKYLAKHSTITPGQLLEVYEFVKQEIERDLNQALQDAKDALDLGMNAAAAEQTFSASMVICGINGAKAFLAVHPEFKKERTA